MAPLHWQGSTVSWLQSHFEETIYFYKLRILESRHGFESGKPALGIQHSNH